MEYKVIVKLQIPTRSDKCKYMYKTFDLPFAPFEGLTISHRTKKGEIDEIEIKEVTWDNDEQCFICYAEPDREIAADVFEIPLTQMTELMDSYFEADWLPEPESIEAVGSSSKER